MLQKRGQTGNSANPLSSVQIVFFFRAAREEVQLKQLLRLKAVGSGAAMAKDGVAAAGRGRARGRRREGTKGSELPQIALNKAKVVCVTVGDYIIISTRAERMAVMSGNKAEVGSLRRKIWQGAPFV